MKKYVHEITLPGDSEFVKKFNYCSELFGKAMDNNNTQEERDKYWDEFLIERYRLESGY